MIYGYIPLIAVAGLTVRFAFLPKVSVRSKWIVACSAVALLAAYRYLPAWRAAVILAQIAVCIFLILYLKVASDAH